MKYVLLAFLLLLAPPTPAQTPATVTATLKPSAPKVGDNTLDLLVADASGKPVSGLTLSARVAMTSMDMGTAKPAVKEMGGGHYAVPVTFSMAGPWRVTLRAGAKTLGAFDFSAGDKSPAALPVLTVTLPSTSPAAAPSAAAPPVAASSAKPAPMPGMKMDGMKMDEAKPGEAMDMADMKPLKMPQLKEKGVTTVTGQENWKVRTGFGKNYGMVAMMNQMMVEGTGMDKMKMDVMKMDFSAQNFTEDEDDKTDASAASMPGMKMDGMKMNAAPRVGGDKPKSASAPKAGGMKDMDMKDMDMKNMDMSKPSPGKAQMPPAALTVTASLRAAPKVGDNPLDITVLDAAGKPVAGASLTTRVEMTSMDMGTAKPPVKEVGGGKYAGTVKFSMAGPWRVTVKAAAPGQKPVTKAFDFTAK